MRLPDRNQLLVRAMSWCTVFAVPLVGCGYLAGKYGSLWLGAALGWTLFVGAVVARLPA